MHVRLERLEARRGGQPPRRVHRRGRAPVARLGVPGLLVALIPFGGCSRESSVNVAQALPAVSDSIARSRQDSIDRARRDSVVSSRPGYVIDSILPVEEEIRRFQATAGTRPLTLAHGATSRTTLVAQFVRALERSDKGGLASLVVDRAEFAFLIYPTSPNAAPPYRQSPELVWLTRSAANTKAAQRVLARVGGRSIRYAGFTCPDSATRHGTNTIWAGCTVELLSGGGDTTSLRMFGPIVQREGRFKFLSLTNAL